MPGTSRLPVVQSVKCPFGYFHHQIALPAPKLGYATVPEPVPKGAIEPRATQIHQKPRVGQGHLPLLKAPEGGGLTVRIAVEEGDSLGNPGQYVHQGRYRGHPGDIMAPWRSRQKVDVFP